MRRILIDTHILIWWLADPEKIKPKHLALIANPENIIYVSITSFFEISLKVKKGKPDFKADFVKTLIQNNFEQLVISLNHVQNLTKYNFPNQDPFDMLLISQALSENLEVMSYDQMFKQMPELALIS